MSCNFKRESIDGINLAAVLEVWRSGGTSSSSCSGDQPVNPSFVNEPQARTLSLSLPWGDIPVNATVAYSTSGIAVSFNGPGINHTESMPPRYRRNYEDWTLTETASFTTEVTSPQGDEIMEVTFRLAFEPICRLADTDAFCGNCLDPSLYNIIDIDSLTTYPLNNPSSRRSASLGGTWRGDYEDGLSCPGKPLDIDVVCGLGGADDEGDELIPGGVTMYFDPRGQSAVPVINNIVYDTTAIPPSDGTKANVIKIITLSTRDALREWTCANLSFATVTGAWTSGSTSSSSSGVFPDDSLTFNWPYNDLYFSRDCPGGDTVNLIPC